MTRPSAKLLLWRLILAVGLLFVLWRVITLGLADYFADTAEDAERVLAWNSVHPTALYVAAQQALPGEPLRAIDLARRAFAADPGNARPLVLLAQAHLANGDEQKADALADKALELMPTRVPLLLQLTDYWNKRSRLDRVLSIASTALTARPALGKTFYPALLKLVETPQGRRAFTPLTQQPPAWWDDFYAHVAARALSLDTMGALTSMRRESPHPLSEAERDAAVDRLQKEDEWPAAYLLWVNGLSAQQRMQLGSVYNGNFELEVGNRGFDWRLPRFKGVKSARQKTFGIKGEKSLHVIFEGREFRFSHLYQPLFLAPGDYEFFSHVRPDGLQGRGGLQWVIHCAANSEAVLGSSERFLGTSEWRRTNFRFSVPSESCTGQTLRLQSTGTRLFDHKLAGEIWLDQAGIRRIRDG